MTKFYTLLLFALVANFATAQITVTDADLGSGTYSWTADQEYILDGYVYLEDGGVLNIAPGTVIKGKASPSNDDQTSALIIARGAKINAVGTADEPIIFTFELDNVEDPSDLNADSKGLWGGLIVLGNAVVGVDGGEFNIEGLPSTEANAVYGGTDNDDDSGVIKYVSIRHGGSVIGADNEINGLTLGGVGAGTTIDYIEVFANKDDGIELFGGAVSIKHAVVSFCGDDSFDFDQGWDGNGQFWFSLQDLNSNRAGEFDGSEATNLLPSVTPVISNVTAIGAGSETVNNDGNDAFRIRDAAAIEMHNFLVIDFVGRAIKMDNDFDGDSYDRFVNGDFAFSKNIFYDLKKGDNLDDVVSTDGGEDADLVSALVDGGTVIANPYLGGISRKTDGGLDPRPAAAVATFDAATQAEGDFFDQVDYVGAFASTGDFNSDVWINNWTALSEYGYLGDKEVVSTTGIEIESLDVFPNPTAETLNITSELLSADATVVIYAMNGSVVKTLAANNTTTTVDVSELLVGNYIATIVVEGKVAASSNFRKN